MKKMYLKLFFMVILAHSLAFIYACDNEDSEYSETFTQKRKPNHQDDLRVSKKFKVEATQSSDLKKESESNINSSIFSNLSESVDLPPLARLTSEIENNIIALDFIKNGLIKVNLDEHEAAILDYEQVFEITGISNELKASAYLNHGFVKIHLGQSQ